MPNLKSLSIQDCINVSDETIAAICQLLTSLKMLHIQVSFEKLYLFFSIVLINPNDLI